MDREIVQDLRNWFFRYVETFKSEDNNWQRNIDLKKEHTKRVCIEILNIGQSLELSAQDLNLAEIVALFHDIGRFEQYVRYQTFVDLKSVNHAELGVKILQEHNVLGRLNASLQDIIMRIILYHNHAALPQEETETCLLFTKLLRDADKLDIWRLVTEYYHQKNSEKNDAIELGLPNTPGFSHYIYQDLMERRIVDFRHLKNLNDFKLLQIGWIYDVNFRPTFQYIKERGYLKIIRDALPQSKEIEEIFCAVLAYLDEKTNSKKRETSGLI